MSDRKKYLILLGLTDFLYFFFARVAYEGVFMGLDLCHHSQTHNLSQLDVVQNVSLSWE